MSRWNENNEWRQLGRWLAVAAAAVYVALAGVVLLICPIPFAEAVVDSLEMETGIEWVAWIFRIVVIAHIAGIIWFCCRAIDHQDGEWPN